MNEQRTHPSVHSRVKRAIDLMIAGPAILFCFPIFALTALIIKCTSPGPVFFCQSRVGLNGSVFVMYKLRTMFDQAENHLSEIVDHVEWDGPVFRVTDDPRITSIGRLLRRFSIDELPQLFNVLLGDMSVVGPRPHLPEEVSRYDSGHRKRLECKPGMTCLWQIQRRHRVTFSEWIELDLDYIKNWSVLLDLRIIMRTIFAVMVRG